MYMLFAGDNYYPLGGWADFIGTYDTLVKAVKAGENYDWYHVVYDGKIVFNESNLLQDE